MISFEQKVFNVVKKIPRGKVLAYKQVAQKLGNTRLARAVGNVLNKNRDKIVPCHRVVKSDSSVGGYTQGTAEKIKKLKSEGVKIKNGKVL
jgi:O-6-methylguanine DNA methyltransferase